MLTDGFGLFLLSAHPSGSQRWDHAFTPKTKALCSSGRV
ncbi:hypothetical protein SynA1825c_00488 [Synechococcus sp. A18-25c]|nr:hypothetical protein SynA1825c_00488 [Synechococcus sp. A18-25c]